MGTRSFKIQVNDGYTMVNLDNELDYNNCKAFEGELIPLLAQQNHVVINCELITALPKDWFRALHRLQCDLKKNKKILKLIHVGHSTLIDMKREGIESIFEMSKDLSSALKDFGMVIKRSLDTEFINPFLNATMNVLQIQAGVDVVAGKVFRKQDTDRFYGDISGLIGIISDAFTGSVVISFPEETFLKVMSKMLGEEYTKIDQDIVDGAGEITNMIFGQAKIVLNEKGYGIKSAIPSVVTGKDHTLSSMTKGPIIIIPFESPVGKFFVEICLSA